MARRRNKASQGGRRQHGRRPPGKNRSMLAWPGEEIRLSRKDGANTAGDRPGKIGACWRDPAKKLGFAWRKAPTKPPAIWEKPGRVGVTRRRNKASQGGRRQHGRRSPGKTRSMLAWPGEEIRLRRKEDANKAAGYTGKTRACWRDLAKK